VYKFTVYSLSRPSYNQVHGLNSIDCLFGFRDGNLLDGDHQFDEDNR
jgi:hypothetical protein